MAYLQFGGTAILGMAAAVPQEIFNNLTDSSFFSPEEARKIVERTGVLQRRIAPPEICASDLCQAAAEKLLGEMGVDRGQIDVLIVNTQTPDYKTPGTSNVLQHKLGLAKTCATYDINLGPSGFLLGLSLGFSLLQNEKIRHVLLLCGETASKAYSLKDRNTGLVFGDAGTACLLGRQDTADKSHFLFATEAPLNRCIMIPSGGYRSPSSLESLREKTYPDGSVRSGEQCAVDREALHTYIRSNSNKHVQELLSISGTVLDDVDIISCHAFDKETDVLLMADMMVPPERKLSSADIFGDTGSAALILNLLTNHSIAKMDTSTALFTGIGAGLSMASALLKMKDLYSSGIIDV